ncbi:hypothetical protein H5410_021343 [Solanum commersonii]|uniref:Uncharacterized protein n=1 Tax=Solanum commersonii TaxID=4109 RepID=A0A9J5ZGW8_SOLCO|nr:hypothetical protein H5410_021343 [Solanum commersonii]
MDKKDTKGDPTNKDINKIVQQNNYTNQLLYVDKPSSSYKDKNKNLETHPIFKLPKFSNDKFSKFQEKLEITDDLIGKINENLKYKAINTLSKYNDNEINKLRSNYSIKKNYYKRASFPDM